MSQQLGLNYQMSPEVMYITPNIWRLGIIFISVNSIAFGTKVNPHLNLPMIRLYQLFVFSNFDHVGEMATSGSWGVGEKVLQRQSISVDLLLGWPNFYPTPQTWESNLITYM